MQKRFVVLADGKGGHQVELGFGTPMLPQPAPAMISGGTPYYSPRLGEVVRSEEPSQYLRPDARLEIGNGEAMTRPQPDPSGSTHRDIVGPAERIAEAVPSPTVSDHTGTFESAAASDSALELAYAPEVECMVDHTLADLDVDAQWGWYWFRVAQLYALHACVPLLRFAEAHEAEFRAYCGKAFGKDAATLTAIDPARASIESLVFALQVRHDPEARNMKRAHRAECANAIGWFAHLCAETERDKAVELARALGRIAGIATLYRKHKDEKDPSRQERAVKAKAARNARMSQSEAPPSGVPVSDVPTEGSAAKIELLSAVATAVAHATSALNSGDRQEATQLLDHLREKAGIRPVVNPVAPAPEQLIVVLLQVGETIIGPIYDKSMCTAAVAQIVTEHLQRQIPPEGLAAGDTI
jgi:hypothetical protein